MASAQDNNQLLGFEHSPTGRSTVNILYTCLPILVTCIWTSLQINLSTKPKTPWKRFWRKVRNMLISILAPEYMLGAALMEHIAARKAMHAINDHHAIHSLGNHVEDMWTLTDGFFSGMKGFRFEGQPIDADRILALMKEGKVLPVWSHARAIKDGSKSDDFAKVFACTQASWLVIQGLIRKVEALPTSFLELGTIGYVLVSVAVYGLLWRKPTDVTTPIDIASQSVVSADTTKFEHADEEHDKEQDPFANQPILIAAPHRPTIRSFIERHAGRIAMALLVVCCAAYGGYHCFVWNFVFSSPAEKRLWHVSSLLTCLPVFWIAFILNATTGYSFRPIVYIISVTSYVLLRAILVVEMFISLHHMPAGVFETVQWTNLIPHF